MSASKKAKTDWEAVEREYRAGVISVREIARKHATSEGTIRSRAKREDWQRDLTDKVRSRASERLSRSVTQASRDPNADDDAIVEQGAQQIEQVVRLHRKDIADGRTLVELMFGELKSEVVNKDLLAEIAEQHIDQTDADTRAANAIRRAISLPSRAGTLRDLSQSLQRLVTLERQAFSVDDDRGAGTYEERLRKLLSEDEHGSH